MDDEPTSESDSGSPLQTNIFGGVNLSRACEVSDAIAAWVRKDPLPKKTMFYPQRFETFVKEVMHTSNKSMFGSSGRRNGDNFGGRWIENSARSDSGNTGNSEGSGNSDVMNNCSSQKEGENPFELVTLMLEEIDY